MQVEGIAVKPQAGVARIVRVADLAGTFLFALEGGLTGIAVGFDPVGVLVLAFLTALGGGVVRDVLIGALPPAAVSEWRYTAIVLTAALAVWVFHVEILAVPPALMISLDAAGLALFAVAGTDKSLVRGIHPLVAIFLGTVSGVCGGTLRDIIINQMPRVLRTDIYASAACIAAIIVVLGRTMRWPARATAIFAGLVCFALRLTAWRYQWELPNLGVAHSG